jgi:hypothetical protein
VRPGVAKDARRAGPLQDAPALDGVQLVLTAELGGYGKRYVSTRTASPHTSSLAPVGDQRRRRMAVDTGGRKIAVRKQAKPSVKRGAGLMRDSVTGVGCAADLAG